MASDEEAALIAPSSAKNGDAPEGDPKSQSMLLYPLREMKKKLYAETCQCILAVSVLSVVLSACAVSFFYCKMCLVGLVLASACICPWVPYFNIPLWISIALLLYVWYFTNKQLHVTWD